MAKVSYFIRHRGNPDGTATRTLVELTAAQAKLYDGELGTLYQPIHWTRAHQIVRDGYMIHETALWLDGERVRRAEAGQ
jgi:hypothetical protein